MEDIKNYISKKRESLSKSSLTTYGSILKNLYDKVFSDKEYDLTKFSDSKKVITQSFFRYFLLHPFGHGV